MFRRKDSMRYFNGTVGMASAAKFCYGQSMNHRAALVATALFAVLTSNSRAAKGTRDPWLWPFASDSMWNTPIGSGAVYVPAGIGAAQSVGFDDELLLRVSTNAPKQKLFAPKSWTARTGGTQQVGELRIDDGIVVPDARKGHTPNNCAALLLPDGKTVKHIGVLCRPEPAGPVYGYPFNPDSDLFGDGIHGSHGGSGLSALGGSIRKGELTGDAPIRHALKVDIFCAKYAFYGEDRKGFRWPAAKTDGYAKDRYKGTNRAVVMGSLLALPPVVTEAELALKTPIGKKLFRALQDYGAYVVDDAAWDCHYLCAEQGVAEEVEKKLGLDFNSKDVLADVNALFTRLAVVDNNAPGRIGGGGTPRAPLAPAPGPVPVAPATGPTPAPKPIAVAIRNGAMSDGEKQPAHWTQQYVTSGKIAVVRDTETFKSAPASLAIESVGGAARGQTAQIIEAAPGTRVALSGFIKAAGSAKALVGVQSYTADWKGVQFTALGNAAPGADWQRFSGKVTLPANTARFGIVLMIDGDGKVWLDDVTSAAASTASAETPRKPAAEPPPKAANAWSPAEGFYPAYPQAWRGLHQNNLDRAKNGGINVLFIGDSLTQSWDKDLWKERYEPLGAANFGIGGDGTPQVLWRIEHGELDGISPKVVVLMIGINNTWPNYSADDTIKGIETIVGAIRAKLPRTKILLHGVLPIWDKAHGIRAKIKAINAGIARLDDGGKTVRFLDFGDKLLAPGGSLGEGLFQKDNLHLTPKAYRIYADALDPLLREMLK